MTLLFSQSSILVPAGILGETLEHVSLERRGTGDCGASLSRRVSLLAIWH